MTADGRAAGNGAKPLPFWVSRMRRGARLLRGRELNLYNAVASYAWTATAPAFPSFDQLSRLTHVDRRHLSALIRQIAAKGLWRVEGGSGRGHALTFWFIDDDAEMSPPTATFSPRNVTKSGIEMSPNPDLNVTKSGIEMSPPMVTQRESREKGTELEKEEKGGFENLVRVLVGRFASPVADIEPADPATEPIAEEQPAAAPAIQDTAAYDHAIRVAKRRNMLAKANGWIRVYCNGEGAQQEGYDLINRAAAIVDDHDAWRARPRADKSKLTRLYELAVQSNVPPLPLGTFQPTGDCRGDHAYLVEYARRHEREMAEAYLHKRGHLAVDASRADGRK
jgi:hypothetical protein